MQCLNRFQYIISTGIISKHRHPIETGTCDTPLSHPAGGSGAGSLFGTLPAFSRMTAITIEFVSTTVNLENVTVQVFTILESLESSFRDCVGRKSHALMHASNGGRAMKAGVKVDAS